jgi:mono/diheme cytochrome c family protein
MRTHLWVLGVALVGCTNKSGSAGPPDLAGAQVARGKYLVESVARCGNCHSPHNADGSIDRTRWLGGSADAFDTDPSDPSVGLLPAPNLTPHATGLGGVSDAQVKAGILDGVGKDGRPLFIIMPYAVMHNMTAEDADAIVAYLRSVPPVDNLVPPPQRQPYVLSEPARPLAESMVPHTTLPTTDARYAQAERGRYLAGLVGSCIDCHTPIAISRVPLDVTKLFAGNRTFDAKSDGLPVPPYPPTIYSSNITPHATGIAGWTAQQVADTIKKGVDNVGAKLCPPMPYGPTGAFGGITDEDALAIGIYLTTLLPIDSGGIPLCIAP